MNLQLNNFGLRKELRLAGATDSEINNLTSLANQLSYLKPKTRLKSHFRATVTSLVGIGLISCAGLLTIVILVMTAQSSLPNSLLYPIKKTSENIAMSVDPNYKGTVMMHRAQEVKILVAKHASSKIVLATLADYNADASSYKSSKAHYSVFEYCKADLQQAEANTSGPERQAIQGTLSSLNDV